MIYWINIFISIFVGSFVWKLPQIEVGTGGRNTDKRKLKRTALILLSAAGPLLVSALRYGIGTDYFFTYIPQFQVIAHGGRSYYEYGFYLLNKFVSCFTSNGQWIIAITSSIFIIIVYYQLFKNADNYIVSLMLFYLSYDYFISLNNIRQSLASAILLIAIDALIHNHNKKFVAWVIVASLFHQVALAYLLIFVITKINLSAMTYMLISIGVLLAGKRCFSGIIMLLAHLLPRLGLYFRAKELQMYSESMIGRLYILINLVFMMLLVLIEIQLRRRGEKRDTEWHLITLSQCLVLCICGLDTVLPAAYRVARIFSFSQFLTLPNAILKYEKNRNNKIIMIAILILGMSISFLQNYINGVEEVFPYVSIFG